MQVKLKNPLPKLGGFTHGGFTHDAWLQECAGEWLDVDENHLRTDTYIVLKDGEQAQVWDSQITAVMDDARRGHGVCKYCGAVVKEGEEEKHFATRESRANECSDSEGTCIHLCTPRQQIGEPARRILSTEGNRTVFEETIKYVETSSCSCADGCVMYECRKRGIEWFTPRNTFFLRYPTGCQLPSLLLPYESWDINAYTLESDSTGDSYVLYNTRNKHLFVYDGKHIRHLQGVGYVEHGVIGPAVYRRALALLTLRKEWLNALCVSMHWWFITPRGVVAQWITSKGRTQVPCDLLDDAEGLRVAAPDSIDASTMRFIVSNYYRTELYKWPDDKIKAKFEALWEEEQTVVFEAYAHMLKKETENAERN